jgi:hypothetical protein
MWNPSNSNSPSLSKKSEMPTIARRQKLKRLANVGKGEIGLLSNGGFAVKRTAGPSDRANSPHPSSREGHLVAYRDINDRGKTN